jgi:hypothetical protein
MKPVVFLFLISIIFGICCVNCNKDCGTSHYFELPIYVSGVSDTVRLNDTIRVKVIIPERLRERDSEDFYDFINYDFKLITGIVRLDSVPVSPVTETDFDWITLKGQSIFDTDLYTVHPENTNQEYQYEVFIIPKKKGLFEFSMNSIASYRINPLATPIGRCSKGDYNVVMELQDSVDVNFEFLQESSSSTYMKLDRKRFDEFAGCCFYVR